MLGSVDGDLSHEGDIDPLHDAGIPVPGVDRLLHQPNVGEVHIDPAGHVGTTAHTLESGRLIVGAETRLDPTGEGLELGAGVDRRRPSGARSLVSIDGEALWPLLGDIVERLGWADHEIQREERIDVLVAGFLVERRRGDGWLRGLLRQIGRA